MTDDIKKLLDFGRIGLETGQYEQAREDFEKVLTLDPSNREAMKGLARVNEILNRRMATPVEPTRAEPVQPPRKASVEPTKPEVEPAKPRHTGEPTTRRKGKRRWLALAVIPVALIVLAVAYPRVAPTLLATPTPTSTPMPMPTSTLRPTQREDFLVYKEQTFKLLAQWSDTLALAFSTERMSLAGPVADLQRIRRDWKDLDPPDVAITFHRQMREYQDEVIARLLEFMEQGKQIDWTETTGCRDKVDDSGWKLFGNDWVSW